MKRIVLAFSLAAGLSSVVLAAEYKGTIIDEKCSKIPAMKGDVDCATKCIKGGSPAVLLSDDGKVYKIADQAKVTPMAGKQVTITGKMEGGSIKVDSVK